MSHQSSEKPEKPSRRKFLKDTGAASAAAAFTGALAPGAYAGEDNTIGLALIGCGGRGSGAVGNAMRSAHGPVKLVAMADIVEERLNSSHKVLSEQFGDRIDVPKDRQFIGF
ncbi:MAG: twin-arginine translocation signal domain-containing protein, partial [Candidatus Omnitrophica bacterium]|nr:twin-arginine translocation signal domain-containing protein [Candidatus Omnitrophota bacterium]